MVSNNGICDMANISRMPKPSCIIYAEYLKEVCTANNLTFGITA